MERFYRIIVGFPKVVVAGIILLTLLLCLPLRSLRMETDVETMMPEHHPVFLYNKKVEEIFGTKKMIIIGIIHEGGGGVFNPATLELVEQLSLRIESMDGIVGEDVVSLRTLDNIIGTQEGLEVVRLMETAPQSAQGAEALRDAVFENEMFINNVVSPDGTATSIFAKLEEGYDKVGMYDRIKRMILDEFEAGDNQIIIAGRPVIEGTIGRYAAEDMRRTLPLVSLVSLLLLFCTLRLARGVILPLAVVIASVIWTLGIMSLADIPLHTVNTIIPVLLMAIGLAYGIHIISRYYEEAALSGDGDRTRVVLTTMRHITAPVIMASLTTAGGFLSLATSDMMPIRYLGIFTAIGVVSALLFSLTFIPAWLALLPLSSPRNMQAGAIRDKLPAPHDRLSAVLLWVGATLVRRPGKVVAAAALVMGVGIIALFRVYVDNSLLSNFQPGSEVLVADAVLNNKFGGTNQLNIILEGDTEDAMKSPDILKAVEELQREIETIEEVGPTLSITDYIKRMNRVMNESKSEFSRIPDTRELIAQYLLLYSLSGDPDDFDEVVDYEYRLANLRVRINSDHSHVLRAVMDKVEALSAQILAGLPVKVHLAGHVMTSYTFSNLIVRGQILSILSAILMVYLITAFMFKSPAAGCFCIIPVSIATLLNFSAMGAAGIPLGVTTALLSGMGIGIGVDYAIHFVARYRSLSHDIPDYTQRVQATLVTSGRAILFNAVVITAGFLVLLVSNFPPSRWLSVLVSFNMIACFLGALTVLPACLILFKPKFADSGREELIGAPSPLVIPPKSA